jgi:hypothetical protein
MGPRTLIAQAAMSAASDFIFVLILGFVPLFLMGYGIYAFFHVDQLNSRLGGPPTVAARILLRVISCVSVAMGLVFSVTILVNLLR